MNRTVVHTDKAPKAIGPYSQAIVVQTGAAKGEKLVFCSGQIPLDPNSGEIVGTGDVKAQAQQVMTNLKNVLEAAGSSLSQVVKTTIFLADLGDFGTVNEVYGSFFKEAPPARSTIQVAGLPRGARVEIEATAIV